MNRTFEEIGGDANLAVTRKETDVNEEHNGHVCDCTHLILKGGEQDDDNIDDDLGRSLPRRG